MSNLALVTDNMLPVANETFIDNLSAGISAGAAIVPINSLAEYADGDSVVLTVDPGTASQATFIGEKQGNTVIDCKWTEGNVGASHAAGATVIDYDSATHFNVVTKLLRMFANENGSLKTSAVQAALNIPTTTPLDYTALANAPGTVTNLGNHSEQLTFASVDYTDRLSPGTRLRTVRTTPTNGYMGGLLNGTSQYFTKVTPTGSLATVAATYTIEAYVYLTAYQLCVVAGRGDAAENNGFMLRIGGDGILEAVHFSGGSGNYKQGRANQAVPLNKKVHLACTYSGGAFQLYIDGISIPTTITGAGTNPGSAGLGGDWSIGRSGASNGKYLPGYISNVAVYSTDLTAAVIRQHATYKLIGNEASCVGAWALDNALTDQNANANNLTAVNAAGFSAISPFGTQANNSASTTVDYAIVTSVTKPGADTIVTVQTPEGCIIPASGTVASISYASAKAPYGFPTEVERWKVSHLSIGSTQASPGSGAIYNVGGKQIVVPIGAWEVQWQALITTSAGGASNLGVSGMLSTSNTTETDPRLSAFTYVNNTAYIEQQQNKSSSLKLNAATTYYMLVRSETGGTMVGIAGNLSLGSARGGCIIEATLAYL